MLRFVGDVNLTDWDFNFGFGIGSRIDCGFNPFMKIERAKSDLWIGNFEGVASDVTEKEGMASEVFRVTPNSLKPLPHFDIYGFANNHAMQHGKEAYKQTVKSLIEYGCKVFGENDNRSIVVEHQGKKVSLTGCCFRVDEFTENPSYWYNPEYNKIAKEIEALPREAFKVFFVHWGNEYIDRPSTQQKKFAHWLIDAGFDLIIGMHPHVLQGYEDYKGKRIYYSLGNFVFDMAWEPCRYGAIVGVDISGNEPVFEHEYIYIDKTCTPCVIEENKVPEQFRYDYLNKQLLKEENSEQYHVEINKRYKAYSKANRKYVVGNMLNHPRFGVRVLSDFIKRRIIH